MREVIGMFLPYMLLLSSVFIKTFVSNTMFVHPVLRDIARVLQCNGRHGEAHFVASLLHTAHAFAMLLRRSTVRVFDVQLGLQRFEIGSSEP